MKTMTFKTIFIAVLMGALTTGCYTQLETVDRTQEGYTTTTPERTAPAPQRVGDQPVRTERPEREDQIESIEDYEMGYEDGWEDAESYFFKDYETKAWYSDQGATLGTGRTGTTVINNYYGYYHDPFFYSPHHYAYYPYPIYYRYPRFRHSFAFSFGWGYPRYGYYHAFSPFYTVYPGGFYYAGYRPYYGFYGHNYIFINTTSSRAVRNVQARSSGLRSGGLQATNRNRGEVNRSSIQTRRTDARSNIRSDVRSRQVDRATARTRVEGRSGTVRSRTSSGNVRNRSTGTTRNRGNVNRSSSNNRGSSGNVQRRSTNNNRSSGNVNRSSNTTNRSSGNVQRQGNTNRSSGSVNRSSGNNNRSSSGNVQRRGSNNNSSGSNARQRGNDSSEPVSVIRSQNSDTNTRSIASTGVTARTATAINRNGNGLSAGILQSRVQPVERTANRPSVNSTQAVVRNSANNSRPNRLRSAVSTVVREISGTSSTSNRQVNSSSSRNNNSSSSVRTSTRSSSQGSSVTRSRSSNSGSGNATRSRSNNNNSRNR